MRVHHDFSTMGLRFVADAFHVTERLQRKIPILLRHEKRRAQTALAGARELRAAASHGVGGWGFSFAGSPLKAVSPFFSP